MNRQSLSDAKGMRSMGDDDLFVPLPGMAARRLGPHHRRAVRRLCRRSDSYFLLATGAPAPPDIAEQLLAARPQEARPEDKLLIGLFAGSGELVGLMDVIRNYPQLHTWHLGLLLLAPARRGQGLGTAFYRAFERWAAEQGARGVRIGVLESNEKGRSFWQRLGFADVERRPGVRMGSRENVVWVMRRALPREILPSRQDGAAEA